MLQHGLARSPEISQSAGVCINRCGTNVRVWRTRYFLVDDTQLRSSEQRGISAKNKPYLKCHETSAVVKRMEETIFGLLRFFFVTIGGTSTHCDSFEGHLNVIS